MPDPKSKNDDSRAGGFLRPGDQYVVALGALLGLVCLLSWWIYRGGLRGDLVEADRAAGAPTSSNDGERAAPPFCVDVNQADWPQFAQLPGIGEEIARRIVAERDRGGDFASHDDLARRVAGIGPRKMARIGRYLRFSSPDDARVED